MSGKLQNTKILWVENRKMHAQLCLTFLCNSLFSIISLLTSLQIPEIHMVALWSHVIISGNKAFALENFNYFPLPSSNQAFSRIFLSSWVWHRFFWNITEVLTKYSSRQANLIEFGYSNGYTNQVILFTWKLPGLKKKNLGKTWKLF